MSAASQNSPLINLSRESSIETPDSEYQAVNVEALVAQGLHSCMFGGRPRSNGMVEEDEIEFLHEAGTPGPGNSSTDPIVISDSPDRNEPASHHRDVEMSDNPVVQVNVVSTGYNNAAQPGGPYLPEPTYQSANSMTYTFPHLSSFPHLSYQIRLSIPQSATSVFRPTPMYPYPPSPFTEHAAYQAAQHGSQSTHLDFGGVGATQKMIEDFTVKTRFIKRIPSKNKAVNAKRHTPQCPICLEEFQDKVKIRRLRCIHNFHIKCIDQWLVKNMHCPVCRKSIVAP